MNDSHITLSKGGMAFVGDDATRLFQAVTLRSGIGLLQVGIRPSRGWTMTGALKTATTFTGKTYKRTEADKAKADLTLWIETMKAALPVIRHD